MGIKPTGYVHGLCVRTRILNHKLQAVAIVATYPSKYVQLPHHTQARSRNSPYYIRWYSVRLSVEKSYAVAKRNKHIMDSRYC